MAVSDRPRAVPVNEAALQAWITELAGWRRWRTYHTHDSRHSPAGFPDLVLVRGARLVFAELKTAKANPTPDQWAWLDALEGVGDAVRSRGTGSVETYLWRPGDMGDIERILT